PGHLRRDVSDEYKRCRSTVWRDTPCWLWYTCPWVSYHCRSLRRGDVNDALVLEDALGPACNRRPHLIAPCASPSYGYDSSLRTIEKPGLHCGCWLDSQCKQRNFRHTLRTKPPDEAARGYSSGIALSSGRATTEVDQRRGIPSCSCA